MRRKANEVADELIRQNDPEKSVVILREIEHLVADNTFVAQLLYRLRDGLQASGAAIQWLEKQIEARGTDLEEVLVAEQNRLSSGNVTMSNLIKGQEDYVYVWTLGVEGIGDGSDKLVTIDVNPASNLYGQVVHSLSVSRRGEAHHMGFTEDRRYLWAGGLDDSRIYIFDVYSSPRAPRLVRTLEGLPQQTGLVGPHTFYAMPGRMLVQFLSNTDDHGGVTGMAVLTNKGDLVQTYRMPTTGGGDGYGYDIGVNPGKNVLLTSSFAGWNNYMMDFGKMVQDPEAMKRFGNTMVLWDLKSMQPKKVFAVPGAPLEIRWSLNQGDNWAVAATALTRLLARG